MSKQKRLSNTISCVSPNSFLTVSSVDHKGQGLVSIDNTIYSVPNTVPGDVITVMQKNTKRKTRKKQLKATKIIRSTYKRFHPFCSHYTYCGGCSRQEFSYADQLQLKSVMVQDIFKQLALPYQYHMRDIIPCRSNTYYRNKIDYSFSTMRWVYDNEIDDNTDNALDRRALGFHVKGFYDRVVQLQQCFLHLSNNVRNSIDVWARNNAIPYYNSRHHTGILRTLTVRSSLYRSSCALHTMQGNDISSQRDASMIRQCMGILSIAQCNDELLHLLRTYVESFRPQPQHTDTQHTESSYEKKEIDRFDSFYVVVNSKKNDDILDLDMIHLFGNQYIIEQCGHIYLRIYPKVFYQTNSRQAETLYTVINDLIETHTPQRILDVYCGIGSIGLFLAKDAMQVTGIDIVPQSIQAARENAKLNSIKNIDFFCYPAEELLHQSAKLDRADVVIVDPPRAGLHQSVIQFLKTYKVPTIIYVSCNPFTMVRDIELLQSHYRVDVCQPVDMFPHTAHVEVVVRLKLIKHQ